MKLSGGFTENASNTCTNLGTQEYLASQNFGASSVRTNQIGQFSSRAIWSANTGHIWPTQTGTGERGVKDTDHPPVHHSVHLCGERKLSGAIRMCVARQSILGAGKTPQWG